MDRNKAMRIISRLRERANAGDPKAKAQLAQIMNQANLLAQPIVTASEELLGEAEGVDNELSSSSGLRLRRELGRELADEVTGLADDEHGYARDEIDVADMVARHEPTGDDLAFKSRLRSQRWTGLNEVAPFARTNAPPSVVGAILVNTILVTCGAPPINAVMWTAHDDAECTTCNVTVQPLNLPKLKTQGALLRPFARVMWGVRGAQLSADVDVLRGCQLVVSASSVQVLVGLDKDISGNAPPPPNPDYDPTMIIAAELSFTGGARQTPVTRTVWMDTVNGAAITLFPIPPFAKRMIALTRGAAVATARQVVVEDIIGNSYSIPVAASTQLLTPFDLPDDVVNVAQADAAGTHDVGPVAFIFELSL
jgi:hypothetical protein